jgi:hypothetical protein
VGPACQLLCPNDSAQTTRPASRPRCHHCFPPTISATAPPTSTASRGYKRRTPGRGFPLSASFTFTPPCSLCPPLSIAPLFADEYHHPSSSSSVEPTRRASATLLHVATTCSLGRRSVTHPGECSPLPSSSSWSTLSTVVPR